MFISIIIPTCDRTAQLTTCLLSLANQVPADGLHFEVIISDDSCSSSARAAIYPQFSFAKWVKGPGCGPATNRNNGAIYSNGDWLAFLDDDCIPDADYLEKIWQTIIKNPTNPLFEGYTYPGREKERYDEESAVNTTGGNLWSCNLLIKRNLFLLLHGFCEEFTFPAMEDIDFYLTVKGNQIPVYFASDVKVCHPWRKRKSLAFKLKTIQAVRLLCKRHPVIKNEFSRPKYLYKLLAGLNGRTRLLWKFRFRGFRAYLEDHLILFYYFIRI